MTLTEKKPARERPVSRARTVARTIRVGVWPVWAHLCAGGGVRTVKFDRAGRAYCGGCATEALYVKPAAKRREILPQGGRSHF